MADNENGDNQSSNNSNDEEDEEDVEDDEATLDEEDELNGEEEGDELKDLQEENELSVEELRRKYYGKGAGSAEEIGEKSKEEKHAAGSDYAETTSTQQMETTINPCSSSTITTTTRNMRGKIMTTLTTTCEAITQYFKAEDLEEDDSEDYMPPELWKKEIRVGEEYQVANIPAVMPRRKVAAAEQSNAAAEDAMPAEVLWVAAPERCSEQKVVEYLVECEQIRAGEKARNGSAEKRRRLKLSPGEIVPDDENALLALYQADYDLNRAKARAPFELPALCSVNGPRLTQPPGQWRTWSEEDCANFEKGMLELGKRFWKIRRTFLPNRMLGEIVCFYYSWKKSERYDVWRAEKSGREQQQQMDVNSTDLMGKIAESILHGEDNHQQQQQEGARTKKGGEVTAAPAATN